ncbi:hypothetical protein AG1IA_10377 [Rhizoctonia solani AG-1 IA]|uniref:Uncharacterized protein n=1 Tax=Thanatephorus cucumeris (strain AG1-IA) TaxID=983506 RepID=L8WFN1_THACA|nr:hypothetical protein AG1IA_10377 [Rhizoctonia solani AG-1 IA]
MVREFELAALSNLSDGASSGLSEGYRAPIRDFQPNSRTPVVESVVSQEPSSKLTSYPDNDEFVTTDTINSDPRALGLYREQPSLEPPLGSSSSLPSSSSKQVYPTPCLASLTQTDKVPN